MSYSSNLDNGVAVALLEARLLKGEIQRSGFIDEAMRTGLSAEQASTAADMFLAVANNQAARRASLRPEYDYIVVGSGAAGAVAARRLSENRGVHVLLLEAGGDDLLRETLVPETWFMNLGTERDWSFSAYPHPAVNGRAIHQAMGKALGGGTSINGMVWARGHKHDFDEWARESGDDAWGYEHVLDVYRRMEDWHGEPDSRRRGSGGPVFVQPASDPNPMAPAFVAAAAGIGIPTFADQNGAMQEGPGGAAITNVRIRHGRRLNIPADYLYPVMDQPNLTVLTGAHVHRLTMEGRAVTGVVFRWQGSVHTVRTSGEVVLSAGAVNTPKLLMLSGIGDRAHLNDLGVRTVSHLPGVGRNFQDHPIVGSCLWEAPGPVASRNNSAEANLFMKSDPGLDTPDLHIFHIEVPYASEITSKHVVENTWSICPGLVRPKSRGHLRLKSSNPEDSPEIHANMLGDPRDLVALRKGMAVARELGNSAAMRPFVKRELIPGARDGEALDQLIRNGVMSMHHPASTAKMGRDDNSVVDSNLRVYGVQNLRVADASVMPRITTGNTHAPCVLIGERLAEILTR